MKAPDSRSGFPSVPQLPRRAPCGADLGEQTAAGLCSASIAESRWICAVGFCVLALLLLALLGGCQKRGAAASSSKSAESPEKKETAGIAVENGQTIITLDAATQNRLGFTVATLSTTVARAQAALPAVVLSPQELAASRNSYVAAQAQLQKARLQAALAAKEHARLKTLYGDEQNISQKSLEAAQAAVESDETDVAAAEQQLKLQASAIRQQWGPAVAAWCTQENATGSATRNPTQGGVQLQRVLDGSDALIQMTVPAGAGYAALGSSAPRTVSLELPGGGRHEARLVSAFPRLDPRIQGSSYLYLAPGGAGLAPGLTLEARLPVGSALKGVVLPTSAVVWSEARAWVYVQVSPERFSRTPVATDVPVENGFFAAFPANQGFSPGTKIVTTGAQALLSEEILLHSQGSSDVD